MKITFMIILYTGVRNRKKKSDKVIATTKPNYTASWRTWSSYTVSTIIGYTTKVGFLSS